MGASLIARDAGLWTEIKPADHTQNTTDMRLRHTVRHAKKPTVIRGRPSSLRERLNRLKTLAEGHLLILPSAQAQHHIIRKR